MSDYSSKFLNPPVCDQPLYNSKGKRYVRGAVSNQMSRTRFKWLIIKYGYRDKVYCYWCGQELHRQIASKDHFVPVKYCKQAKIPLVLARVVPSCTQCNFDRGCMTSDISQLLQLEHTRNLQYKKEQEKILIERLAHNFVELGIIKECKCLTKP